MTHDLERSAGVAAGEILADKYRVERVLGVGGMGVVVEARHLELDERVAIKFLLPTMLLDANAVARFQREARAAVRIKSEHVARVFDVGRLTNGAPYMVMEYLEGLDLAALLERDGTLPARQAVDFVLQACVAVADAHALGIIHRDLKPANLFCIRRSDGQPSIKVLDFGISKLSEAPGAGLSFTHTSATMGSPLYMSPEQFRSSKNVDARTDIWALGTILFELVTGSTPFKATTVPELAIKIATERAPSAATLRHDVPAPLAAVIARCLEREPDQRYRDVGELTVALAPFASATSLALVERVVGILGRPNTGAVPSSSLPNDAAEARTAPALQYTSPPHPRRRNVGLALGLLGAAAGLGAVGVGWWRTRATSGAADSATAATGAPSPPVEKTPSPEHAISVTPTAPVPTTAVIPAGNDVAAGTSASARANATLPPSPVTTEQAPSKVGALQAAPRKGKRGAAAPAALPPPRPGAVPTPPSPAAAPAAPARASCDPPFFFDSHGNRVFKQECL
jgi:serine/threonine protein kinase